MKKCPEGEYYCNEKKKCRPIPKGYHTARGGYLVQDTEKKMVMEMETVIPVTETVMEMAVMVTVMEED